MPNLAADVTPCGTGEEQGMTDEYAIFNEADFNRGMHYFIVTEVNDFMNIARITGYTPVDYTTFINPPVDDSVYGC